MANINKTRSTIDKQIRERHMEKSIEYSNPNLKEPLKARFPPMSKEQEQRARNILHIEETIKRMPNRKKIAVGGIKVDHEFKGFITYRKRPINWDEPEIKIEFNNVVEFMKNFINIDK